MHPNLRRLAESENRTNRNIAIEIAKGSGNPGLLEEVQSLGCEFDCYVCGEDFHHHCSRCDQPICENCDASGITSTKIIDYDCCENCVLSMNDML